MNLDVLNNCDSVASLCVNFDIINHFCPTHYWPNAQPSLIDIAFTKFIDRVQLFSHFNLIPSTHHDEIIVSYNSKKFCNNTKTSFSFDDYNKIDNEKLVLEAKGIKWSELIHENSIDRKVEILNKNYFDLFASNVPKTIVRIKHNSNNWFNRELNLMINERNRLYDVYKVYKEDELSSQTNIDTSKRDYVLQCKRVNNYINYLKKEKFRRELAESKSQKDFWRIIKNTGCSKENDGIDLSHNIDVNLLNDHFINIHSSNLVSLPPRKSYDLFFDFDIIDIGDVYLAIQNITSNAVGHDGIALKFLKLIFWYFADAIVDVFNYSIECANFPKIWNLIKIKPIEKNSNPTTPADTRPITINCLFTKILCLILNDQVKHFIESNNIISQFQSGFRNGHSCTTALMKVSNDVRKSLQNNRVIIMVLFDIKSAYPSVSHELLLHCLKKIGFCERALKWVSCFISNKVQYVSIENLKSDEKAINCGLLQGDNLSQTFFSIVINEIVDVIESCQMHLYADDLMIYKDCDLNNLNNTITEVNKDIDRIHGWVVSHGMKLNASKTRAILISTPGNNSKLLISTGIHKITVDNIEIPFSSEVKYLGFHFNNEFTSSNHTGNIIKKINFALSKVASSRKFTPKPIRIRIINNVISPIFDYGSIIYHGHGIHGTMNEEKRLQLAQNSCIRYIFNLPKYEHISPFMKELGLLNLYNRRIFLIACFIHKYLFSYTPPYLNSLLTINNNNTRAGTDAFNLVVGRVNKVRDEHIFDNCLSKLWNKLPLKIRSNKDHDVFRKDLKLYLLNVQNGDKNNSK